eukprot:FR740655.1.p1 GENE.FR740655.1~~FR740655.1.p1  ORF type:complete len:154 (+),score=17.98 FR740655.1:70-462(+)
MVDQTVVDPLDKLREEVDLKELNIDDEIAEIHARRVMLKQREIKLMKLRKMRNKKHPKSHHILSTATIVMGLGLLLWILAESVQKDDLLRMRDDLAAMLLFLLRVDTSSDSDSDSGGGDRSNSDGSSAEI